MSRGAGYHKEGKPGDGAIEQGEQLKIRWRFGQDNVQNEEIVWEWGTNPGICEQGGQQRFLRCARANGMACES
jgi:hypothetical protein